jgi:hypothetical protein
VTAGSDLVPRRLVLAAAELAVLYARAGAQPPADFQVGADDRELRAAVTSLTERGVLEAGGAVHLSVMPSLSTLTAPELAIQTRSQVESTQTTAMHAATNIFGASLWRTDQHAVELSFFPAVDLGRELRRVVPQPAADGDGSGRDAESREREHLEQPERVFRAAALERSDVVSTLARSVDAEMLEEVGFSEDDREAADWVSGNVCGVLHSMVIRPGPSPRMGQVVWYATRSGWLGLRGESGQGEALMIRLVPVRRDDYTRWLAPYIAEALA